MKGDIILVEAHHQRVAARIVEYLADRIAGSKKPYTITVAGESGSGKSETAQALLTVLGEHSIPAYIFQQDDYFVLPPKSNDARRREEISWVGTGEVNVTLLNQHLEMVRNGQARITKPLVEYNENRVDSEDVDLERYAVLIAEGTYTSLLENIDTRVFIDRNRLETLESRKKRSREAIQPFLEQVLEIEHRIIAPHRERADVIIGKDYDVSFVTP